MSETNRHLAAILAVELETLDIPGANTLDLYRRILEKSIEENGGTSIAKTGFDVQVEFGSTGSAIRCAAGIQQQLTRRNTSYPDETLKARIGIHLGEIHYIDEAALGDGVSTARRLCAACKPGGILVSEDIARRGSSEGKFRFEPAGGLGEAGTPRYIRSFLMLPAGHGESGRQGGEAYVDPSEIRDYIMDEVKRAGRRIDGDWLRRKLPANNPDIDRGLNWLVDRGFLDEKVRRNGRTGYSMPSRQAGNGPPVGVDPKFLRYRKKITREAGKAMSGFRAHVTTFLAVNAGLVVLNILTSPRFPWALFPIFGWGIGIVTHYVSARVTEWKKKHMDKLPDLDREQYSVLKKIHNGVSGFAGHASSNAAVAALLVMTNIVTSSHTPWSLIPITAMAVPVFIHWTGFRRKMRILTDKLKELLRSHPAARPAGETPSNDPSVIEAERLRSAIMKQVEAMGDRAYLLGDDIPGLLDSYVSHIRVVSSRIEEIEQVIAELPVTSLKEDRRKLEARLTEAGQPGLKEEYRKSIKEIDDQLSGCRELQEQGESVRLKLRSSLNSLKQLQLDIAKAAGASNLDSEELNSIEREIREFSEHLDDLQAGYDELE